MRVRAAASSLPTLFTLLLLPGSIRAQMVGEPLVQSTVPARFETGDTVRVSFRYEVPDSVGRARIRVLLLDGGEVVGALRRVRPSVAHGTGVAQALEVFDAPQVVDGIRVVLSGSGGFLQEAESPLAVATRPGTGDLRRPGWVDPGGPADPGDPGGADVERPTLDPDRPPRARSSPSSWTGERPWPSSPNSPVTRSRSRRRSASPRRP